MFFVCLFSAYFRTKNDQFAVKFTRMLGMREQSVEGLLFFLQRPVEEATILSACCWSLLVLIVILKTTHDSCCTLDKLDIRAIPIITRLKNIKNVKSYRNGQKKSRNKIKFKTINFKIHAMTSMLLPGFFQRSVNWQVRIGTHTQSLLSSVSQCM